MRLQRVSLTTLLIIPALAYVAALVIYPAAYAVVHSFIGPNGRFTLANYEALVPLGLKLAIITTLVVSFGAIFFQLLIALAVASVIAKLTRARSTLMTLVIIPMGVATVVSAVLFSFIFQYPGGIANEIMRSIGLAPVYWLNPKHLPIVYMSLIIADSWKTTPIMILILYAGMLRIPQELYESAAIDGAGPLRRFARITVPNLRSFIGISLLIRGVSEFNIFALPLILVGYNPPFLTTLTYELYSSAITVNESYASATILLALAAILIAIVYRVQGGRR